MNEIVADLEAADFLPLIKFPHLTIAMLYCYLLVNR